MPPDELHDGSSIHSDGYQVRVFSIDPKWFSELADLKSENDQVQFSQLIISNPTLFQHMVRVHQALGTNNLSQLQKIACPMRALSFCFVTSAIQQKNTLPLGNQSISTLKDYLMENLAQPVKLEELSQLYELSPTQFQRHFKAKVGLTPYAWLSRLRLECGFKLLKNGVKWH